MRICLPQSEAEVGGSGTFRRLWRGWLSAQNISWTDDLQDDYEVLFVNAWQTPYPQVYQHKKRLPHLRVIHRVDGAGKDYGRTDGADAMQHAVNTLADATIFQSDYSRRSTHAYHLISLDGDIIYNPVDTQHYTPEGEKLAHPALENLSAPKILSAIWSPNRRKGAWRLPPLAAQNPNLTFIFIGGVRLDSYPPNLIQIERLNADDLAKAFRHADLFLNLSENDPCPNIVLEAMASGLPVLYLPSGGTPELVGEAGLPLADDFSPQSSHIWANLDHYQQLARQRALREFDQTIIFPRYWAVIQASQRRKLPTLARHMFSYGQMGRLWVQDKIVNPQDWMMRG